jgi:hypothetical protein
MTWIVRDATPEEIDKANKFDMGVEVTNA